MNGDAYLPAETLSHSHPLDRLRDFVEHHPAQAMTVAAGVGVLARLLPRRFMTGLTGYVMIRALPAALLTLGALKAAEILTPILDRKD